MPESRLENFIKGVIDRFEGVLAVIKIEDGQTLHWPIKKLPDGCREGSAVRLKLTTDLSDDEEREKVAKKILGELLKKD